MNTELWILEHMWSGLDDCVESEICGVFSSLEEAKSNAQNKEFVDTSQLVWENILPVVYTAKRYTETGHWYISMRILNKFIWNNFDE